MMKMRAKTVRAMLLTCIAALFVLLFPFSLKFGNDGGMYATNTLTAHAASRDLIRIEQYNVDMRVRKDRRLEVREEITVAFLASGLTMFYRSLPTDGARYENFVATCPGNQDFSYHVADNPDMSGFIDVNCVGGAKKGNVWKYYITYTMEQATGAMKNSMIVDVIGFGWTVPLHNVTATVRFPDVPTSTKVYTDIFGSMTKNEVKQSWSADGKSLILTADILDRGYSGKYNETVTGGITVKFSMSKGVLKDYTALRIFTPDMWKIVLAVVLSGALSVWLYIWTCRKQEIVTVVNIKAPDEMDPMKMGKWLDGTVNGEDVTSMVYYFANKGYIKIDMTDEKNPILIRRIDDLPADTPAYEKTLFEGLFKENYSQVSVSDLSEKFYDSSE